MIHIYIYIYMNIYRCVQNIHRKLPLLPGSRTAEPAVWPPSLPAATRSDAGAVYWYTAIPALIACYSIRFAIGK